MITSIEISGFKRFSQLAMELAPLTVLTGTNGAGKTSVIHALLLCREACREGATTVQLNGPFGLELGSAADVLNIHAAADADAAHISITLSMTGGRVARFTFDAHEETLLYLPIVPPLDPSADGGQLAFARSNRIFTYLCAERLGPRDVLGASAQSTEDLTVGTRGEYCAQILEVQGLKMKVPSARRHPSHREEADAFLKYQVERWLTDIVRPIEIDTVAFANTAVTALRFRAPSGEWVRAPNMGFGVSYALPVVLAGLFMEEEGLLVVENPEAHLHPAGQSRMGTFLALVAASGVQVLLETHSDHVLNGIRRAIGEQRCLEAGAAVVHFFDQGSEEQPLVSKLSFTALGGLDKWPRRFFDQYQIDVAALAHVRRGSVS